VSVVTPFYNTARYLREAVESVLKQDYRNWEYVLVDNCSTDGGRAIAEEYAGKDARIRVVANTTFLTQVQNYNEALRHVSPASRYCKIVQADDWIFPECLSRMVAVAEAHPSVGIVSAYTLLGSEVYLSGLPYPSECISGREVCRAYFTNGLYVFGNPNWIMYRSDAVRAREPFFDEASPAEDTEVCFEILRERDLGFVHQVLTYTRRENESITSGIKGFDPGRLTRFRCLKKYGRHFLDAGEYDRVARRIEADYFALLGEGVIRRRPKAFWDFHLQGMASVGATFTAALRRKYAALALLRLIGNPLDTVERLCRAR
jgi:glycosyltransferase involved in cell wall biosynthesis